MVKKTGFPLFAMLLLMAVLTLPSLANASYTIWTHDVAGGYISPSYTYTGSHSFTVSPDSNRLLTGVVIGDTAISGVVIGTTYDLSASLPSFVTMTGGSTGAVYTFTNVTRHIMGVFVLKPTASAFISQVTPSHNIENGATALIDATPSRSDNIVGTTTYTWTSSCGALTADANPKMVKYTAPTTESSCVITLTVAATGVSPNPTATVTITSYDPTKFSTEGCLSCHHGGIDGPDNASFRSSIHYLKTSCMSCHDPGDTAIHPFQVHSELVSVTSFKAMTSQRINGLSKGDTFCSLCHIPSIVTDFAASKHSMIASAASCSFCHAGGAHDPIGGAHDPIAGTVNQTSFNYTSGVYTGTNFCLRCHHKANNLNYSSEAQIAKANNLHFNSEAQIANICVTCHNPTPHNPAATMALDLGAKHFNGYTSAVNTNYRAAYVTPNTLCANCHITTANVPNASDPALLQQRLDWAVSGHGDTNGKAWLAYDFKTLSGCVQCHTTTGFIAYSSARMTAAWGSAADKTRDVLSCNACHTDIGSGELRTTLPIQPYADDTYINPNVGNTSNLCLKCHSGLNSGRSIKAKAAAGADFGNLAFISSHSSAAAGILFKSIGYEFSGREYGNKWHFKHDRIGISQFTAYGYDTGRDGPCVGCHMNSANKHTFSPLSKDSGGVVTAITSPSCSGCHTGPAYLDGGRMNTREAKFAASLLALQKVLETRGIYYSDTAPYFFRSAGNSDPGNAVTNWGNADTMGAAFNFSLLKHEPGAYAHNMIYTKRLISDSIDFLDNYAFDNSVSATINNLPSLTPTQKTTAIGYLTQAVAAIVDSPPGSPTGISATAGDSQATISWTAGAGSTKSLFRYGPSSGSYGADLDLASAVTKNITGLTNGTIYKYQVGAWNANGTAWSAEAYVTPVGGLPSAPTGISATAGDSQATISWTAGTGSTSSLIRYGTAIGVYGAPIDPATSPRTISSLTNGQIIYYQVGARNAGGTAWSAAYSVTPVLPPLPAAPTAISSTPGYEQATIQWTAGTSSTSSLIKYKLATDQSYGAAIPVAGTSYVMTPLTYGLAYSYQVGAKNSTGITWDSTVHSVTPLCAPPTVTTPTASAITTITATLGANVTSNGGAAITARGTCWGLAANPTTNCLDLGSHDTGEFTQGRTGLPEGSRIYYRGYATNSVGTNYSSDGTVYTEPTQPVTLSFPDVGATGMTVNWATVSSGNAKNVIVVMKSGPAVNFSPIDGTTYTANAAFGSAGTQIGGTGHYVVYKGPGTSVIVTGLSASTTYTVKVYAFAAEAGAGADGTENYNITAPLQGSKATTAVAVPTLISPTATAIGSSTATLGANVTSNGGAAITARGTVWGTAASPTGNAVAEEGTATSSFTHERTGLTVGTKIYYRGYATNSVGTSYSPEGSFYTEPATQASGVTLTPVNPTSMTVDWARGNGDGVIVLMRQGSAVTGAPTDGIYTTYTASTTFGSGTLIGDARVIFKGSDTSVTVTGLTAGTTYYVAVFEYKGTVDTSGANGVNQGTNYKLTPGTGSKVTPPEVPTGISATAGDTQVTISWTAGTDSTSSLIRYGTATGVYGAPIDPATSPRTISGLANGTPIYYQVGAMNAGGTTWSAEYSATPRVTPPAAPALTAQATPQYVIGSGSTAGITFQWSAVTAPDGDAVQYQVDVSSSNTFSTIAHQSAWQSGLSWDQALGTGTWYWRVRARDSVHTASVSADSAPGSFAIVDRTPAATTPVHPPSGSTSVTLQWSAVIAPDGDAVQYQVDVSSSNTFASISYQSSWQSGTSWSTTVANGTWYWRVRAQDATHTAAVSTSSTDSFSTTATEHTFPFDYTGTTQTLEIPVGAINIQFSVKGAGGAGAAGCGDDGANGHLVTKSYSTGGVTLIIYVGEGGKLNAGSSGGAGGFGYTPGNPGSNGDYNDDDYRADGGGGGGGSSAILFGATPLTEAAGGNGGASCDWVDDSNYTYYGGSGGAGGGTDLPVIPPNTGGGAGGGIATPGGNGRVVITYDY